MVRTSAVLTALMATVAVADSAFWYSKMDHEGGNARGYAPDLENDQTYPVYMAVNASDGNGIQNAIDDNRGRERLPQWWASQPRVSDLFKNVLLPRCIRYALTAFPVLDCLSSARHVRGQQPDSHANGHRLDG